MAGFIILLVMANAIWSGSYAVMKWGILDINPISLVFYRMFLSTILLWPVVLVFYRKELAKLNRSFFLRILLVAFFDLIHQVGLCVGVQYTYAMDASLIISMEPAFLFLLATIILREELTARHVMALILAMVGFMILSSLSFGSYSFMSSALALGNIIILFAVISESGFTIFFKPLAKNYSPILLMAVVTLIQSTILAPVASFMDPNFMNLDITFKSVSIIVYLSLFCTIFGYVVWLFIMKKIPVNVMAISLFLQPVFGPLISFAALGEEINSRILIGGLFIILSLFVITSRKVLSRLPAPNSA